MKIVNAEKENPRMIILKITKKQGFIFTLKNTFLKKPQIEPEPFWATVQYFFYQGTCYFYKIDYFYKIEIAECVLKYVVVISQNLHSLSPY